MENSEDMVVVDPLFVGMTRPATVWGVPYTAVAMESVVVAIVFLAMGNPLYLLLAVPIHGILYLIGSSDSGVFDSIMVWIQTSARCMNRAFWGAASFSPGKVKKWTE